MYETRISEKWKIPKFEDQKLYEQKHCQKIFPDCPLSYEEIIESLTAFITMCSN